MSELPKTRSEIPQEHCWDLSPLYADDGQWESDYAKIEGMIPGYAKYRGRLSESPAVFREAVEFDLGISRLFERLHTYIHLRNDEDRTNSVYKAMFERSMTLHTKLSENSSWFVPEIQSMPENLARSFRDDPLLSDYTVYLDRIFRFRPHTRSEEIETLLAMAGEVHHAPSEIFTELDNADLRFGMVKGDDGKESELTHGNFSSFLQSADPEVRKNAFFSYYKGYDDHKHTIAASYSSSVKKDRFYARVRNFPSALEASLFGDNIGIDVYDNLISAVRANIAPLAEYLDFRKKKLGLDELHFYDTYVPLVNEVNFSMPYEEAVETCIQALAPLGEDYTARLRKGLLGGWVDRYENRGKRSGAYSSGCFDSPPYILLNYRDDNINSLYTLIHEAGHSMHSLYSHETQPYHYGDYTIFVAEVASTFNETLLSAHLLEKYRGDPSMRAYILNREIDNIRATLYRQTMFAEFEKITHQMAEKGEPLTLDSMRTVYRKLIEDYFGGALAIDDVLELEGLRIPHFYHAFYVYKYATGISAAIALARRVLSGDHDAVAAYRRFLGLGGSMYPLDELNVAGVDMSGRTAVDEALGRFSSLVKELINTLEI
jgi:oligoendopeptidase F